MADNTSTFVAEGSKSTIGESEKASNMAGHPLSHASGKKKLGKNLNKLMAMPAVPATQSGSKSNAADKNGLLLLSTKRTSAGSKSAGPSASSVVSEGTKGLSTGTVGGILSTKTGAAHQKPLPVLGLHTESNTSTHDALMGVVVGASRVESEQQPDAWRVAEMQQSVEKADLGSPSAQENDVWPTDKHATIGSAEGSDNNLHIGGRHADEEHLPGEFHGSNWDEYGGRNVPRDAENANSQGYSSTVDGRSILDEHALQVDQELQQTGTTILWGKIGQEVNHSRSSNSSSAFTTRDRSTPRKLFDPNSSGDLAASSHKESHAIKNKNSGPETDYESFERQQPKVEVSSYDDLGRGSRGTGAGPRMLFDPKSGTMVEVSSGGGSRNRKERTKKERNNRENEIKKKIGSSSTKSGRNGKGASSDERNGQPRGAVDDAAPVAKKESRKGRIVASRRLPRTCGVLFSRDKKGAFTCGDKCDGDLGYGVHSVPGGRVRNPSAFSAYQKNKKSIFHEASAFEQAKSADDTAGVATSSSPEHHSQIDWIKPNEKIELITGVDESPTLKANASEWVPSNLAYSAMKQTDESHRATLSIDDNGNNDDDIDEQVSQFCLQSPWFHPFSFFVLSLFTVWSRL